MDTHVTSDGGARQTEPPSFQPDHTRETADSGSPAVESGTSSPDTADESSSSSRAGASSDGESPEGVECRPSPRAVEQCESPVHIGTERVTDPVTGVVKGERKILKACGSSRCEACRERRRRQLVAHYKEQFWSAKRLRFVTLTLDKRQLRRAGITSEEEVKAYLKRIWSLLLSRLRSRCGRVRFYKVMDRDDSDGWHIHAVLSANVPEQVLRWQWFEVGGGCVLDCRRLSTPSQVTEQSDREQAEETLARAIGYIVYKSQHVEGARAQPSEGDGYSSPSAVEKRKRWVENNASSSDGRGGGGDDPESVGGESPGGESSGGGSSGNASSRSDGGSLDNNRETQRSDGETTRIKVTDESLSSPEEVLEAVKKELRSAVGEWLRLDDGTRVRLLKVADTLTVVEEGADRTRTDVQPFDVTAQVPDITEFIPMDRSTSTANTGLSDSSGPVLTEKQVERAQQAMRRTSYVGTNEAGKRVRWTYDRENQTVRSEELDG